jgi:hypothetical protein
MFADPESPQTWNVYSYGLNNPLLYSDPTGHEPCVNGINPETGNICVVATGRKPVDPQPSTQPSLLTQLLIPVLTTKLEAARKPVEVAHRIIDWASQPRYPVCMAAFMGTGATIGGFGGGTVGALGFAGDLSRASHKYRPSRQVGLRSEVGSVG